MVLCLSLWRSHRVLCRSLSSLPLALPLALPLLLLFVIVCSFSQKNFPLQKKKQIGKKKRRESRHLPRTPGPEGRGARPPFGTSLGTKMSRIRCSDGGPSPGQRPEPGLEPTHRRRRSGWSGHRQSAPPQAGAAPEAWSPSWGRGQAPGHWGRGGGLAVGAGPRGTRGRTPRFPSPTISPGAARSRGTL